MDDIRLGIELDTDRRAGGLPHLLPGDHAEGNVAITPRKDLRETSVEVRLRWRTEGRGESDGVVVVRSSSSPGPLSAGQLSLQPFSFRVPEGPWSFEGAVVRIVWQIEATVATDGSTQETELPVVIAPLERAGIAGPW